MIWCTKNFCATMFFSKVGHVFSADETPVTILFLFSGANLNFFNSEPLFDFYSCATLVNSLYLEIQPRCEVTSLVNVKLKSFHLGFL